MIAWIILGAVAGWLATVITGSDDQFGCLGNIILGMIGSFVGGFLANWYYTGTLAFTNAFTDFNIRSIVVSTIGAVVVLIVAKLFK